MCAPARIRTATNETGTITHTASATGGYTASITATRSVTVDDNDDPGLTINPSPLSLNEGRSASYTVNLVTAPTANVTVTIARQTGAGASNAVEFNTDNGSDLLHHRPNPNLHGPATGIGPRGFMSGRRRTRTATTSGTC